MVWLEQGFLRYQQQACPMRQSRPHFPGCGVKGDIGTVGDTVIRANIGKTVIDNQAQDTAVLNHYAFRLTG
ncbi:hypothetical protein Xbed_03766 [Xenorhabdus beddingii]|uniref:Uncharacterized protein n=1 Tax=Xenorhabdus beddingii TaxID=40578 RepID=A0A1Y2S7U0_9GAMM|nr:hypothetical protein Xbed_03766 [Xenorhabdus beddingii]